MLHIPSLFLADPDSPSFELSRAGSAHVRRIPYLERPFPGDFHVTATPTTSERRRASIIRFHRCKRDSTSEVRGASPLWICLTRKSCAMSVSCVMCERSCAQVTQEGAPDLSLATPPPPPALSRRVPWPWLWCPGRGSAGVPACFPASPPGGVPAGVCVVSRAVSRRCPGHGPASVPARVPALPRRWCPGRCPGPARFPARLHVRVRIHAGVLDRSGGPRPQGGKKSPCVGARMMVCL